MAANQGAVSLADGVRNHAGMSLLHGRTWRLLLLAGCGREGGWRDIASLNGALLVSCRWLAYWLTGFLAYMLAC
jgi:hypothetical protein